MTAWCFGEGGIRRRSSEENGAYEQETKREGGHPTSKYMGSEREERPFTPLRVTRISRVPVRVTACAIVRTSRRGEMEADARRLTQGWDERVERASGLWRATDFDVVAVSVA